MNSYPAAEEPEAFLLSTLATNTQYQYISHSFARVYREEYMLVY